MRNKVKVIRSANKTIVIYGPETKAGGTKSVPVMKQKPVLVYSMGKPAYYIMPSGRIFPIRKGRVWRTIKFFFRRAQFVAI